MFAYTCTHTNTHTHATHTHTQQTRAHCAGGFFINWSMTSHMPASMSLISIYKQRYAAAAGGGLHALQFLMAGVYVQVRGGGSLARDAVGATEREK